MLEVRTGAGDLVWRFDRDGPKPRQAIPASVAADMAGMMSHVVSEGTARRAALDGIPTAGKTGTTNAYRDAWFVGYTGNFTCAVWYGNDDYSATNRMTGGSLPAQTWHDIMVAAHQGVEIKELAGVGAGTKLPVPAASATVAAHGAPKSPESGRRRSSPNAVRTSWCGSRRCSTTRPRLLEIPRPAIRQSRPSRFRPARLPFPDSFAAAAPGDPITSAHAQELTVRLLFITLLALVLATVVGLGATWMTATRGTDFGTLKIGAWTARPKTGTADADPYSRASIARSGELPIGTGDGVAFSATTDDRKTSARWPL